MIRIALVHDHLHGPPADVVELDHDARSRRRAVLRTAGGLDILLDRAEATPLPDGAALILGDGREIAVRAAAEPLAELAASDAAHAVRLAWHLGNRHLPTMLDGTRLYIRRDHVIEAMAEGLGAVVRHVERPFEPEGGAYGGHGHAHGYGHAHDHGHAHPHDHDAHDHAH